MEAEHAESVRQISTAAASRYARPPPPIPVQRTPPPPQPPPLQPRQPRTTSVPPTPVPRGGNTNTPSLLTLGHRRDGPRPQNEYVDSPHVTLKPSPTAHLHPLPGSHGHHTTNNNHGHVLTLNDRVPPAGGPHSTEPVFAQPPPSGIHLKSVDKDTGGGVVVKEPSSSSATETEDHSDSIICSRCGKCRCGACTQPRELPSRWICGNKCECSARKAVEVCSCLCCVKCIFYHCCKDSEVDSEPTSADDPCGCCETPHCCRRWTCLGLLSLCLPCLCLYWPLRGGVALATKVYNRCTRRGCHCRKDRPAQSMGKRLLIDSESSSA